MFSEKPSERTTPHSLSASKVICFERLRLWIVKNTVMRDLLHVWESITNGIYHWKGRKLTDLPIRAAYALNMTRWWYEKMIYVFRGGWGEVGILVYSAEHSHGSPGFSRVGSSNHKNGCSSLARAFPDIAPNMLINRPLIHFALLIPIFTSSTTS